MSHHANWLYFLDSEGVPCELFNGERLRGALSAQPICGQIQLADPDCEWANGTLPYALDPCSEDDNGVQTWQPMVFAAPDWPGNPAPWWDGIPGSLSSKAYGFWVEEWTGLDGAHTTRNVSSRANRRGGGNLGSLFSGPRVWTMNVVLVGANGAALEDLFRWLESSLMDCCDPCGTGDMLIRTTCPPDGDPSYGVYRVKNAALTAGVAWQDPPLEGLGCILRRVSFTITVADPCLYSCVTNCADEEELPGIGMCVPFHLWAGCDVACSDFEAYRICCPVPATNRGTSAPIVTMLNDSLFDSPPMRIYGMLDPMLNGCDPCSLTVCQDIQTHPIPAGGTLLVDSAQRRVLYSHPSTTNSQYIDGTPFLDPPAGTVPAFLSLSCDPGWVAVEPRKLCGSTDGLKISVDVVQRVGCC